MGITDFTTLVKIKKNIDRSHLFPEIENLDEIKFISLNEINKSKLNNLISEYREVYFITEEDYLASSNIVNQIKKKSQMQVGETLVLNPKLTKLETEINNLDRQRVLAWRRVESANAENNYYLSITCMDFLCSAKAIAAAVSLGKAKDNYNAIEQKLQNTIYQLESTPAEISKPRYKSYEFIEQNVEAKKRQDSKLLDF